MVLSAPSSKAFVTATRPRGKANDADLKTILLPGVTREHFTAQAKWREFTTGKGNSKKTMQVEIRPRSAFLLGVLPLETRRYNQLVGDIGRIVFRRTTPEAAEKFFRDIGVPPVVRTTRLFNASQIRELKRLIDDKAEGSAARQQLAALPPWTDNPASWSETQQGAYVPMCNVVGVQPRAESGEEEPEADDGDAVMTSA